MAPNIENVRVLEPGLGELAWDVVSFDPTNTYGLSIVGEAQAGKTTLRDIVAEVGQSFYREGEILHFSNSNGFRGLTSQVLEVADVSFDDVVPPDEYLRILEGYIDRYDPEELASILDALYYSPLDDEFLRNEAVNSAVALTSEHSQLRPIVNAAGARHMRRLIEEPDIGGMSEKPWLVVLDARNQDECQNKFLTAGVKSIGTLVLTCPEEVVIERKFGANVDSDTFKREVAKLKLRNETDRNRIIGRMTLPEDLRHKIDIATLVYYDDVDGLYDAGRILATVPNAGAVFATNDLTKAQEAFAVDYLARGVLNAVSV